MGVYRADFLKRSSLIALLAFFLATGIEFSSTLLFQPGLETSLGLDALFKIRGSQPPPAEVVIVAMDDAETENALNVNEQYLSWRGFQAGLIKELQRQQAALIVFDLHFLSADPKADPALAQAMQSVGNVLLADCVQRIRLSESADFDGRRCSGSQNRRAFAEILGNPSTAADELVAMRKIAPTALLANAALDHAPFYVANDAGNPVIRQAVNYYDNLAETPSLPLLTWLYYLQSQNQLAPVGKPLAVWLSEQRRACLSGLPLKSAAENPALASRIQAAVCQGDNDYLDYFGPAHSLRMVSYLDVYKGKAGDLQGKVVFVGKAKLKSRANNDDLDYFETPFSDTLSGNMSGVEIMATQFANLTAGHYIQPLAAAPRYGLLLALALLMAGLFGRWGWLTGTLAGALLILAYAAVAVWAFNRYACWLPLVAPCLQLVFISLWDLFAWLPFSTATKQVRSLCMATDIEGYTGVAESLTPTQLDELLTPYFNMLTAPVIARSAKINDITGDAMMALWFDLPVNKQRISACQAALEICQAVADFNAVNPVSLPIRIGLFEGDIKIRPITAGGKRFYRAVGNTLNIASRIEGVNKILGTHILAEQSIAAACSEIYCRPVGRFCVLGREEPLALVEIVGYLQDISLAQQAKFQQFQTGLAAFQQGHWQLAAEHWQNLLHEYGEDGPSRYYLKLALAYRQNPPLELDVVRLAQK